MKWKKLIAALRAYGLSQNQIAREAGCTQGNISSLARGASAEPSYSLGAKLEELLKRREAVANRKTGKAA